MDTVVVYKNDMFSFFFDACSIIIMIVLIGIAISILYNDKEALKKDWGYSSWLEKIIYLAPFAIIIGILIIFGSDFYYTNKSKREIKSGHYLTLEPISISVEDDSYRSTKLYKVTAIDANGTEVTFYSVDISFELARSMMDNANNYIIHYVYVDNEPEIYVIIKVSDEDKEESSPSANSINQTIQSDFGTGAAIAACYFVPQFLPVIYSMISKSGSVAYSTIMMLIPVLQAAYGV